MPDNDSNLIKPVDALGNINSLGPVKRREKRKRKKEQQHNNAETELVQLNDSIDEQTNESSANQDNQNTEKGKIDFCA